MPNTASIQTPDRKKSSSKKESVSKDIESDNTAATPIPNYTAAMKYLVEGRLDLERTRVSRLRKTEFKLDRMQALAKALGNPQDDLRIVHVAGTKGKGSVCEMTAASLKECGYTVGLYTSPHLVDVRERIRIGGEMITYPAFTKAMQAVADASSQIEKKFGPPTYFEILTALAFMHFAEQAVDIAVIECGLGGRLDATNIVRPDVSVVTSISIDHTDVLGSTLLEIAREKAGIFKKAIPAITMAQEPGVIEAMQEVAESVGATLEIVGKDIDFSYRFEASPKLGPHTCVCVNTERSAFEHLVVPLQGEHQALNCGLALAAMDRLRAVGFETPEMKVIAGLDKLSIPGRMEMVLQSPRVLLDGAHNASSIKALIRSIGAHIPYDSMVVVFGVSEDKDIEGILKHLALGADKVIFTRAKGNPRAMDPHELQQRFSEISVKMSQVEETLPEALSTAARAVARDDLICVTGSFYLVGEAKKHLASLKSQAAKAG